MLSLLIYEFRSVKSEEKIFSVLKMDIESNIHILEFNRKKVEVESRLEGINYIPLKLFKTDFWNLINYNSPQKLIDKELYSTISNAVLIMNSFNEINQIREHHKAFSEERVVKDKIFNKLLVKEIEKISKMLLKIKKSL